MLPVTGTVWPLSSVKVTTTDASFELGLASARPVANDNPLEVLSNGTKSWVLPVELKDTAASEGGWPVGLAVKIAVPPIAPVVARLAQPSTKAVPDPSV